MNNQQFRTGPELAAILADIFEHMLERPLMYGGDVKGVDLAFSNYVLYWSLVHRRDEEFNEAVYAEAMVADSGAASFHTCYRERHPNATEEEVLKDTVMHWRNILTVLGVLSTN